MKWTVDGDGSGLHWLGDVAGETRRMEVYSDARLNGMLRGRKGEEEGEDDGRFLEGRRWQCSVESLVRSIEEQFENVGETREIKRRAWGRSPWEEAIGRVTEVLPWRTVRSWKEREGPHINIRELRAKRRLVARCARRSRNHERDLYT